MSAPDNVKNYIQRNTASEWSIEWKERDIDTAVVIPAIREYENIKNLISSLAHLNDSYLSSTLFLFVINNSDNADDDIKDDNRTSLYYLRSILKECQEKLKIGVIDASSEGKSLNNKEAGVGLARKIGMDLALQIFNYNSPLKKVLICLDADCTVAPDYIDTIRNAFNKIEAASIYFEHPAPLTDAIICYEIFLRYYVLSLRYAKSPYAFHTIGSSMACSANAYVKIGGMNKKKAAEDFYFLEKLAKITKINNVTNTVVYPSQRNSWRVPFGTGQRITRYNAKTHNEYALYNPESFEILKEWLLLLNELPERQPSEIFQKSNTISPYLHQFLLLNNFQKDWGNIFRTSRSPEQIKRQITWWFDGFKTLKLIHYLKDTAFADVSMFSALDIIFEKLSIPFDFKSNNNLPDYNHQTNYLKELRLLDRTAHV